MSRPVVNPDAAWLRRLPRTYRPAVARLDAALEQNTRAEVQARRRLALAEFFGFADAGPPVGEMDDPSNGEGSARL